MTDPAIEHMMATGLRPGEVEPEMADYTIKMLIPITITVWEAKDEADARLTALTLVNWNRKELENAFTETDSPEFVSIERDDCEVRP